MEVRAMRDLHSNITVRRAISPVALGTTGTGKTSVIIDKQGYDSLEFIIGYGTVTATSATVTPVIKECATTGGSFTSVADADLLGTELGAALIATTPRTSGVSKNYSKRVGYRGGKRYVTIGLVNTVSAGIIAHADAVLSNPLVRPVAQ
jgi:hypothetical protein